MSLKKALAPIKQMLDSFSVPYSAHAEVGERAKAITDTARRLRCDHIVMSTARKNSLTRMVENSVTGKVLALTTVPVEVIAGDAVSKWERYGIPAALGALAALLLRPRIKALSGTGTGGMCSSSGRRNGKVLCRPPSPSCLPPHLDDSGTVPAVIADPIRIIANIIHPPC